MNKYRILHICICGPFTDNLAYQDNELVKKHIELGHEVLVIASPETYNSKNQIVHTQTGLSQLACGARLIRLPYFWTLKGWLATKIRAHRNLSINIELYQPDIILFHGLTAWGLLQAADFVRKNPKVKLYADCHEDFNNSARSWLSRELLHKRFYKLIFQRCIKYIDEVLCVTVESLDFAVNFYGSPLSKTRMYPLGCTVESTELIAQRRRGFRSHHRLTDREIVTTQTGKLDSTKQLNLALNAFLLTKSPKLRFFIAGQMTDDVKAECLPLILSDKRIVYLGWQTTDELRSVLAGTDCFLQPYGQTVTTQMAMGYGCVIIAQDLPSHRWLVGKNGYLFRDTIELNKTFDWIAENENNLRCLGQLNRQFAAEKLDYKQLALQILS